MGTVTKRLHEWMDKWDDSPSACARVYPYEGEWVVWVNHHDGTRRFKDRVQALTYARHACESINLRKGRS